MILEGGWWIAGAVSGGRQALGKPTEASFSHRQPRAARAPVWIAPTQATLMLEQTDTWCHRHLGHRHLVSQTVGVTDRQPVRHADLLPEQDRKRHQHNCTL